PVPGEQLGMGATLHDLAPLHHEDLVRAADRGEAVRDHERGPAAPQRAEPVLDGGLALRIEARGGFVEDEDPGVGEDGAGDRHALALAARDLHSSTKRSEEHTSELQSQSNLVCRLLLEKKKKKKKKKQQKNQQHNTNTL